MRLHRRDLLLAGGAAALSGLVQSRPLGRAVSDDAIFARSVVAKGDTTRLARTFAKAARGEPVTLGFIGGSITQGSLASSPAQSYVGQIAAWWRRCFPHVPVTVVNAGLAGTGSLLGAFRVGTDLLAHDPDLVIVEFSVNDASVDADAFEGLLRQILEHRTAPAVLLLFMMWEKGGNLQDMQAPIGRHYGLPMISFRDALWPEMEAGRLAWTDLIVDVVHPNDAGHRWAAALCTHFFEMSLEQRPSAPHVSPDPLPGPMKSLLFTHLSLWPAAGLAPRYRDGWDLTPSPIWGEIWAVSAHSGRIEFDWEATGFALALATKASSLLPTARITIDEIAIDPMAAPDFLDRETIVLASGLSHARHRLRIETAGVADSAFGRAGIRALGIFEPPRTG